MVNPTQNFYFTVQNTFAPCPQDNASCDGMNTPTYQKSEEHVVRDQRVALFQSGQTDKVFAQYDSESETWKRRIFERLRSIGIASGMTTTQRTPLHIMDDGNYFFVTMTNGASERARAGKVLQFVDHSPGQLPDTLSGALRMIATEDGFPNMLFGQNFDYQEMWDLFSFPSELDNRFEKQQAVILLKQRLATCTETDGRRNLQRSIDMIEAAMQDDTLVFVPMSPGSSMNYCEAGVCKPIVTMARYNQLWHSFSMRFTNYVPDRWLMDPRDWAFITEPLKASAKSAEEERAQLAQVYARHELVMGGRSGLGLDVGGWPGNIVGFLPGMLPYVGALAGQTNCNYEFLNAFELFRKLSAGKLLRFHDVPDNWLEALSTVALNHQALKIMEQKTGSVYVVDSWPRGNGHEPMILPEKEWGIGSAVSWQIFPSWESISLVPPESLLAMGATGLLLAGMYARRQIGRSLVIVNQLLPEAERAALRANPVSRYFLELYSGVKGLEVSAKAYPFKGQISVVQTVDKGVKRYVPSTVYVGEMGKDTLLNPAKLHGKAAMPVVVRDYFTSFKGLINAGLMVCFGLEVAGSLLARKHRVISDAIQGREENNSTQTATTIVELGGVVGAWYYVQRQGFPGTEFYKEVAGKAAVGLTIISAAASTVDVVESWVRSDIDLQVRDEEYQAALDYEYHNSFFGDDKSPWYQRSLNTLGVVLHQLPLPYSTVYKLGGDLEESEWRVARKRQLEELNYRNGPYQNAVIMMQRTAGLVQDEFSRQVAQQVVLHQELDVYGALNRVAACPEVQTQFRGWQAYASTVLRQQDQHWLFKNHVVNDGLVSDSSALVHWLENQLVVALDAVKDKSVRDVDLELYQKIHLAKAVLRRASEQFVSR